MWCKIHFNILNRLDVDHKCDRHTEGLTHGTESNDSALKITPIFYMA